MDSGEAGEEGFPVTVVGDAGPVTIEARPRRIVSLSATHTEILYAIGAGGQVAATDLTSNHPPEADRTPKVDAFNFDVEEVAALEPDLVILAFDFTGELEALRTAGIPALLLGPPDSIQEALDQMVAVGTATGWSEAASALQERLADEMDAVFENVAGGGPLSTVYHEVDANLFSANSASFIGNIYDRFGLQNIADRVTDEFASGFPQLSEEFILASDPDLIFLADASFGESFETVAARPGWSELTAVREGRVIELDGDIAGRWGPRTVDLVQLIGEAVADLHRDREAA